MNSPKEQQHEMWNNFVLVVSFTLVWTAAVELFFLNWSWNTTYTAPPNPFHYTSQSPQWHTGNPPIWWGTQKPLMLGQQYYQDFTK